NNSRLNVAWPAASTVNSKRSVQTHSAATRVGDNCTLPSTTLETGTALPSSTFAPLAAPVTKPTFVLKGSLMKPLSAQTRKNADDVRAESLQAPTVMSYGAIDAASLPPTAALKMRCACTGA